MVACLSLWATGLKLSPLAHTFNEFFNIVVGGLQRADTSTAYCPKLSSAQIKGRRKNSQLTNNGPVPRARDP